MRETVTTIEEIRDESGNLLHLKLSDGYEETNTYNENGKLIKSDTIYPNGIREVEHYSGLS